VLVTPVLVELFEGEVTELKMFRCGWSEFGENRPPTGLSCSIEDP